MLLSGIVSMSLYCQSNYYPNGQIISVYLKNRHIVKYFYETGQMSCKYRYSPKKGFFGKQKEWYHNGSAKKKSLIRNDCLRIRKEFYKNGKLASKATYRNDQLHGVFKSKYENGQLKTKGKCHLGAMTGTWRRIDTSGNVTFTDYNVLIEN